MAELVLSAEVLAERWERRPDGWGELQLSTSPHRRMGERRVELRLRDLDPELLTLLCDGRRRWRVTLTPVEEE